MGGSISSDQVDTGLLSNQGCQVQLENHLSYGVAQISYTIDMCEDLLKIECQKCTTILTRGNFIDHKC